MKRYISYNDLVAEGVFQNRMSVPRKIAIGFPKPMAFGRRALRWDRDEVEAWIRSLPRRSPKSGEEAEPTPEAAE